MLESVRYFDFETENDEKIYRKDTIGKNAS